MSERWKPKALYRARAAGVDTDGVKFHDRRPDSVELVHEKRLKPTPVFFCNHNVHWQACTICSKPRSR